jgi:hypothetical protein
MTNECTRVFLFQLPGHHSQLLHTLMDNPGFLLFLLVMTPQFHLEEKSHKADINQLVQYPEFMLGLVLHACNS